MSIFKETIELWISIPNVNLKKALDNNLNILLTEIAN